MISSILLFLTVLALFLSYFFVKDIFSPLKFYFIFLMVFCFDVFTSPQIPEMYFVYTFYLILGVVLLPIEVYYLKGFLKRVSLFKRKNELKVIVAQRSLYKICIISILPVVAQLYLFDLMGGFDEYLFSIAHRIQEWQGLGPIISIKKLIFPLNIFFALILLLGKFRNRKKWLLAFFLHTTVTITIGFLSGSRSLVLNIFLYYIILFHYLRKNFNPILVSSLGVVFLVSASVLNFFRHSTGLKTISEGSQVKFEDINFENNFYSTYNYGIIPIEGIYKTKYPSRSYQFGLTYISAFTNYIPRALWPDKPSSGGVLITKHIQNSQYKGTTHYSTGLVAEGVINFGYYYGYLAAAFILFTFAAIIFFVYKKIYIRLQLYLANQRSNRNIILWFYAMLQVQQVLGAATFGEFTNIVFTTTFNLITFFVLFKIVFSRISY